jgi:hypothetical protein
MKVINENVNKKTCEKILIFNNLSIFLNISFWEIYSLGKFECQLFENEFSHEHFRLWTKLDGECESTQGQQLYTTFTCSWNSEFQIIEKIWKN